MAAYHNRDRQSSNCLQHLILAAVEFTDVWYIFILSNIFSSRIGSIAMDYLVCALLLCAG
jgi:hypothetical protein